MIRFLFLAAILSTVFLGSCRSDFSTIPSTGQLQFSRDTVYLDTTFTNIGSSTYTLKVYNRSANDINIPIIKLGKGADSQYRLLVDGKPGKTFSNIELLAKDSLFIFVETTIDYTKLNTLENSFLYTDKIEFDAGNNAQKVELVTLVKDAVFLYPKKDNSGVIETVVLDVNEEGVENKANGFTLTDSQLTFTNKKPYVIYGYAVVPPSKIATLEAGARVFFHTNSGILVSDNASIQAKGKISDPKKLENEIIFEGDRLESLYDDISGQWGTIWLKPNSVSNIFEYVTIKNASIGIRTEATAANALVLKNTQIYNNTYFGIYAKNATIDAENTVINNAGLSALRVVLGGNYHFKHSTLTNYWTASSRQEKTLSLSNQFVGKTTSSKPLEKAQFDNCIIYGSSQLEIKLDKNETTNFNYQFNHCLLRFNDTSKEFAKDPLYDFTNTTIMNEVVLNKDPFFMDSSINDLRITKESAAINLGDKLIANQIPNDILGVNRTAAPDLGAYQASENK